MYTCSMIKLFKRWVGDVYMGGAIFCAFMSDRFNNGGGGGGSVLFLHIYHSLTIISILYYDLHFNVVHICTLLLLSDNFFMNQLLCHDAETDIGI